MATMTARPILIKGGDIINVGVLHLKTFDPPERRIRAVKMWGLMWLFALLSVPIIVAHFVLVPGFLIAGPVMAYRRYRLVEVPDHVTGMCPTNKEEMNLPLEASTRLPVWTHCQQCKTSIQLLEKNDSCAFQPVAG